MNLLLLAILKFSTAKHIFITQFTCRYFKGVTFVDSRLASEVAHVHVGLPYYVSAASASTI